MKILQIIQKPQLRGAEIFASQLSNQLVEAGHEVAMISLLPGEAIIPLKGTLIQLNRPLSKRFMDVEGWKKLAIHIEELKPDVVQANAGDTLKFAVFSKLFFGWKAPIVFRNANKVSDFIDTWLKLVFNGFLMRRVSHVISVSDLCRQDFLKTYKYDSKKTTTIPIGIDVSPLKQQLASDVQIIFQSGKVLLHVASFVPEKNHEGLLRIMQCLVASRNDVKLVLIGDGKLRPIIEKQIEQMGLSHSVYLLGYRPDVLGMMQQAQAFLMPSKIEGLPGVILEAMYCRAPVIAYDVGGISEVVRNAETGWLIQPGNEQAFVAAIIQVLSENDVDGIVENAFQYVTQNLDNRMIARAFLAVYGKITNL